MTELPPTLRWSTRLLLAGLVVEILSLFGLHHSLGFMIFMTLGCTLIAGGIAFFLLYVFRRAPEGS